MDDRFKLDGIQGGLKSGWIKDGMKRRRDEKKTVWTEDREAKRFNKERIVDARTCALRHARAQSESHSVRISITNDLFQWNSIIGLRSRFLFL